MVWVPKGGGGGVPLGKSTVKFFHRRTAFRLINWCTVGELCAVFGTNTAVSARTLQSAVRRCSQPATVVCVCAPSSSLLLCIGGLIAVTASSSSFSSFCLSLDVVDGGGGGGKLLAPSSPLFSSCSLPFSPFRRCVSSLHRLAASQLLFSFRSVETCRLCTSDVRVLSFRFALFLFHTGYPIKKFFLLLFLECRTKSTTTTTKKSGTIHQFVSTVQRKERGTRVEDTLLGKSGVLCNLLQGVPVPSGPAHKRINETLVPCTESVVNFDNH